MELGKEYFGPLWSFVASNEITDIDYNGKEIWLTNIFNERFRANQQFVTQYMTPAFVEQFTQRIANVVSRQFNKRNPELEAETSELRVGVYSCGACFSSCYAAFSPNQRPKISGSAKALSGCIAVY